MAEMCDRVIAVKTEGPSHSIGRIITDLRVETTRKNSKRVSYRPWADDICRMGTRTFPYLVAFNGVKHGVEGTNSPVVF